MGKGKYGGKYPLVTKRGQGYYGRNDAGQRPDFVSKDWGESVGFVGSNTKEYTFFNTKHGTHTITAQSYEEALRIAESMGYTRGDYKKR